MPAKDGLLGPHPDVGTSVGLLPSQGKRLKTRIQFLRTSTAFFSIVPWKRLGEQFPDLRLHKMTWNPFQTKLCTTGRQPHIGASFTPPKKLQANRRSTYLHCSTYGISSRGVQCTRTTIFTRMKCIRSHQN